MVTNKLKCVGKIEEYDGSVLHFWIHKKLIDNCKPGMILKRAQVNYILYNSHVPKILHDTFLDELERRKLIAILNKQNVKIISHKNKVVFS